mmetsp:Transcript_9348/g.24170  ORF Transcript_9348/g.24170 Transcript_9348/m.24170 type:complete len:302 (-) Transcript_9348:1520-2425(-)
MADTSKSGRHVRVRTALDSARSSTGTGTTRYAPTARAPTSGAHDAAQLRKAPYSTNCSTLDASSAAANAAVKMTATRSSETGTCLKTCSMASLVSRYPRPSSSAASGYTSGSAGPYTMAIATEPSISAYNPAMLVSGGPGRLQSAPCRRARGSTSLLSVATTAFVPTIQNASDIGPSRANQPAVSGETSSSRSTSLITRAMLSLAKSVSSSSEYVLRPSHSTSRGTAKPSTLLIAVIAMTLITRPTCVCASKSSSTTSAVVVTRSSSSTEPNVTSVRRPVVATSTLNCPQRSSDGSGAGAT